MSKLVNAKAMIEKAFNEGYAVPHININNLEWTKAVLLAAEEKKSPLIIGTSEGAVKYMGGYRTIHGMVEGLLEDLNITVPVVLHLDHGSYEGAFKALEQGYTSVMFDGSHLSFDENFEKSQKIVEAANAKDASIELEVGSIGGEEDGIIGDGDLADPAEVAKMAELGATMVAAGIGNIHGPYPESWKELSWDTLGKLKDAGKKCIVLHGGSGIPTEQIKKAISLGVSKINVNSELQWAFKEATKEFVTSGKADEGKNYDPRKLLAPGFNAMVETVKAKIDEFGSANKA